MCVVGDVCLSVGRTTVGIPWFHSTLPFRSTAEKSADHNLAPIIWHKNFQR